MALALCLPDTGPHRHDEQQQSSTVEILMHPRHVCVCVAVCVWLCVCVCVCVLHVCVCAAVHPTRWQAQLGDVCLLELG